MIKVWSRPPSYPLHPWGVGVTTPPFWFVPSDGGFYVQSLHFLCKWGATSSHPVSGSYIFRRILWILLVYFQNISKNRWESYQSLSEHVQFHRKFLRVTGGGAKTGCRLKRFWHRQSGSGSTITGQKKSSPVFRVTGDFSRKRINLSW
jgi:hypothetical protein